MQLSPDARRIILDALDSGRLDAHDELSQAEKEVIRLVCESTELDQRVAAADAGYRRAVNDYLTVLFEQVGTIVRDSYPSATEVRIEGEWNEDSEIRISVGEVYADGLLVDDGLNPMIEGWDSFTEKLDEPLMMIASLTGEDYSGPHAWTITELLEGRT